MLPARPLSANEFMRAGKISAVIDSEEEAPAALDDYLGSLRSVAPHASRLTKGLVKHVWEDAGGERQAVGICLQAKAFSEPRQGCRLVCVHAVETV